MRNELPKKILEIECGIVNLGSTNDLHTCNGSHWVTYYKNKNLNIYFDSFGNTQPPNELIKYFGSDNILYNYNSYQKDGIICGHLCLAFLIYITNS